MITLPERCPRKHNCSPLSQIMSDDETTFICCGICEEETENPYGDIFTSCFKSEFTDTKFQMSREDMHDQISVLSMGMSVELRYPGRTENK